MMPPRVRFRAPTSSAPGVTVEEVDFSATTTTALPFRTSRFTVEPGRRSRLDHHAAHECWMVASGEATLLFDDRPVRIRRGEICYFPPFTTHQACNDGSAPLEIFSVWWSDPA